MKDNGKIIKDKEMVFTILQMIIGMKDPIEMVLEKESVYTIGIMGIMKQVSGIMIKEMASQCIIMKMEKLRIEITRMEKDYKNDS